jgi:DNA polymerase III delta subunit
MPKLVVIENLIGSLRTGTKVKDTIIDYLLTGKFDADVVLWESKSVGKSLLKLKKQKHVTVEDFRLPIVIFKFTESLSPQSIPNALHYLQESLKTSPIEVLFAMVVRQFRLMMAITLSASIPETEKLIPWVQSKLKKQASMFTEKRLAELYKDLLLIDYQTKTGKSPYDLTKRVEQFIISLESV